MSKKRLKCACMCAQALGGFMKPTMYGACIAPSIHGLHEVLRGFLKPFCIRLCNTSGNKYYVILYNPPSCYNALAELNTILSLQIAVNKRFQYFLAIFTSILPHVNIFRNDLEVRLCVNVLPTHYTISHIFCNVHP